MAYTTPRTWVYAELVTAAMGNEQWRDNMIEVHSLVTTKTAIWRVVPKTIPVSAGDDQDDIPIPEELDGYRIVAAHAAVNKPSTSGLPTIQLRNVDAGNVDILSTRITIDVNERTSYTAAAQPVVNTSNNQVSTGNRIAVDVDVNGTGTEGLTILLTLKKL